MTTSTTTRKAGGAAPCGCAGSTPASPCSCAGAGCAGCQPQAYVRPHFFAGQLLTEEDLLALSAYVVDKNRLHNRHFMGDGVVCGLAVTCNPCGGGKLVVHPGHALDCCGNDLVLECAVELDANAMVRDLRRNQLGGADCGDPCAERQPNCDKDGGERKKAAPRHYCLYLRYSEEATDPVAPYATDEPCGPAGCQHSRIREGVRFELRCDGGKDEADGFVRRALACLSDLTRAEALSLALKKLFSDGATSDDVAAAREAMLDWLEASPQLTDCRLRADVAAITVPPPKADLAAARTALVYAWLRIVRDCICRAILPPCPPCDDSAVLLACIEIDDCQVTSICNLERKFVLTGPNLRHWLPLNLIGDALERLCCAPLGREEGVKREAVRKAPGNLPAAAAAAPGMGADAAADTLMTMLSAYLQKAFGLSDRDADRLGNIAQNMGAVFKAGALDDLQPAQLLRGLMRADPKEALSVSMFDSDAFRNVTAELGREQSDRLQEARQELHAENANAAEALARQNEELRTQLAGVMERLAKLEARTEPGLDDPAKKPRK